MPGLWDFSRERRAKGSRCVGLPLGPSCLSRGGAGGLPPDCRRVAGRMPPYRKPIKTNGFQHFRPGPPQPGPGPAQATPAWAGLGPGPAQLGPAPGTGFRKNVFCSLLGSPWLRLWNQKWLPGFLGSAVLAPGVRKSRNPPGVRKKNDPRVTETMGQRPKIRKTVEFLTELGIDRHHLEPKNDFLGPGSPKNP